MTRALTILCLMALAAPAQAEVTHFVNGGQVNTGKNVLDLPAGYYVPEADWKHLDDEVKVLQDKVTQLTAENASFREQTSTSHTGTIALTAAFITGLALGVYVAW